MLTSSLIADLLVMAILGLIALHALWQWRHGRWQVLDPLNMFWAGVLVVYVMQPITYGEVFVTWHPSWIMEKTLFWSWVAFAFVVVGYESRLGYRWVRWVPSLPERLEGSRMVLASALCVGLGLLGYSYMVASAGGIEPWLAVSRTGTDWDNISSYIAQLDAFLPLGIVIWLFHVNMHRTKGPALALSWIAAGGILLWLIYLGTRSRTIVFTLTMLAAYYLPRRKDIPLPIVAVIFMALLVLVPFLAQYRYQFTDLSFHLDRIDPREARQIVLPVGLGGNPDVKREMAGTGQEFNCVMAAVELVPQHVGYNYGYCLLEFFTRPIPRTLWPDKRYPHYEAFTPILEMGDLAFWWRTHVKVPFLAGPAFTFVGHWWAVGGPIALIAAGFLTGAFFRTIRAVYDQSVGREGSVLLYAVLFPIGFFEAASTPLFWIFGLAFSILMTVLVIYFCSVPRGRS